MKGILLFNNVNDIAFVKLDKSLSLHLQDLAIRDGIINDSEPDISLKKDVIIQIFAPLVASYKVMEFQLGNRYRSIETEDGTHIIFEELHNYIVVGIFGIDDDQYSMQKYVAMFITFAKLLYGPSLHLIKETIATCCHLTRSELLGYFLDVWYDLRCSNQMFLVEAVERLLIDQDITATCVNVLESALHKVRTSCNYGGIFNHAFLLVDLKLLALYSSRNTVSLPKDCLLLLILVVYALNHTNPSSTPSSSSAVKDATKEAEVEDISSLLVFLKLQNGDTVPHLIYVLTISPDLNLVIICEMVGKGSISKYLTFLIDSLHNIQRHPNYRQPLPSLEAIESIYKKLIETTKKLKDETSKWHMKQLALKWKQMKECDIEDYTNNFINETPSPRLESTVSAACEVCKTAFSEIVTRPELNWEQESISFDRREVFMQILKVGHKHLLDLTETLTAKAKKNICMSSYLEEYPGLVHFIYVDRSSHFLIAPSVVIEEAHFNGKTSLKNKVWDMVQFGQHFVDGKDNFFCEWHKEDLYYSYRICFEDSRGKNIRPTKLAAEFSNTNMKGILCGNFYEKLKETCFPNASIENIYCFEFFSIHLDSTPSTIMHEHQNRLCSSMWEYSGAYKASLDLL